MEQPVQASHGDTLLEAHVPLRQPQGPLNMNAEKQGKRTLSQVFCSDLTLRRRLRSSRECGHVQN
jgi:hypothetical protein